MYLLRDEKTPQKLETIIKMQLDTRKNIMSIGRQTILQFSQHGQKIIQVIFCHSISTSLVNDSIHFTRREYAKQPCFFEPLIFLNEIAHEFSLISNFFLPQQHKLTLFHLSGEGDSKVSTYTVCNETLHLRTTTSAQNSQVHIQNN